MRNSGREWNSAAVLSAGGSQCQHRAGGCVAQFPTSSRSCWAEIGAQIEFYKSVLPRCRLLESIFGNLCLYTVRRIVLDAKT